ncbi:hypothetical protein [Spirosoma areae]
MADNQPKKIKQASTAWLIAGFVFGILGGFLGILIGGHFTFGPYDKRTKKIGRLMMAVGFVGLIFWKLLKYS